MEKRLSIEQKKEKAFITIINKMFEIAGHDLTFNDIKDRKDNWFTEWTMTVEQNEEWKSWGKRYLMKELHMTSKLAEKEMMWTSMQYGLKFSNFNK
jgi:hypothetical protein